MVLRVLMGENKRKNSAEQTGRSERCFAESLISNESKIHFGDRCGWPAYIKRDWNCKRPK